MFKRELKLPERHSFFLLGPRQTGKSTLIEAHFKPADTLFFNLLRSDEYRRLVADPSIFRQEVQARSRQIRHVVVDEVQRVPDILNEVHHLLESPDPPQFILSGSSARKLKHGHANLLAGRAWTLHLHPLTHRELGGQFKLDRVLRFGSLPQVYSSDSDESAIRTLKAYADTYLREEIQQEAIVRNLGGFVRFLELAADENGKIINYSSIARGCGVSYQTVKEYFRILEDTLVGFLLPPFTGSVRRRVVAHPKFYWFDPGVRRAVANRLTVPVQPRTREYGEAFEHFFILEMLRAAAYSEKEDLFSFYRSENGVEVDLILRSPDGRVTAMEIKSTDVPGPSDLRGLKSFREICPEARLICVCTASRPRNLDGIEILPWATALSDIGYVST